MKKTISKISIITVAVALLVAVSLSFVACDANGTAFDSDTYFAIDNDTTDFMGTVSGLLLGAVENMALNMDETYFVFKKDGTVHGQITTADGLFSDIDGLLGSIKNPPFNIDIDINSILAGVDLTDGINSYAEPIFPGFKARLEAADLKGALQLVEDSLGLNIHGLDYDNEDIKAVVQEVAETKKLPGDLLSRIPADTVLTLTFDWKYRIEEVEAEDGTKYQAIYLGNKVAARDQQTEPFGVFTMTEDENGRKHLLLRIEFININLGLVEM